MPTKSGIKCEGINITTRRGTNPCNDSASYNYKGLQPKFCKKHANNVDKKMVNVQNNDFCIHGDCILKPYKSGIKFCEEHDYDNSDLTLEEKMKSSKVCKYKNCKNGSNYNYKDKQPKFCKDHAILVSKKELGGHINQMRNVKNTTCKYYIDNENDCIAIATCKINGVKMYCPIHAKVEKVTEIMESTVIKKECKFKDCEIIPSYGYVNNGKKVYICCQSHIKNLQPFYEHEIKQLYKECKIEGCNERARKESEEGKHDIAYCYNHGKELKDNSKKICKFEGGCEKEATHNYKEIREPVLCKDHKIKGKMDNKKNITCSEDNCIKIGYLSLKKEDSERYCNDHRTDKMYNYISKKCESCNLFQVRKESKLCSYCNPNARKKEKEDAVYNLLINNNIEFEHDKSIGFSCSDKAFRPDFKIDCGTHFIIIEVDEKQHKYYDKRCEFVRMNNIYLTLGLPTIFIRFNPDKFKINGILNQTLLKTRLNHLLIIIKELINEQNVKFIELYYMYYNCNCETKCNYLHAKDFVLDY